MSQTSMQRRIVLALALAASVAASLWAVREEDPADLLATPRQRVAEAAMPASPAMTRPPLGPASADPFRAHSWLPPALPAAVRPQPPSPPQAPPLPFAYLGKWLEDGKLVVFLASGENHYTVKVGDVIETNYRVDAVRPPTLTLTYLPLGQQQTLDIGEGS